MDETPLRNLTVCDPMGPEAPPSPFVLLGQALQHLDALTGFCPRDTEMGDCMYCDWHDGHEGDCVWAAARDFAQASR